MRSCLKELSLVKQVCMHVLTYKLKLCFKSKQPRFLDHNCKARSTRADYLALMVFSAKIVLAGMQSTKKPYS